ncbi:MAG: GNAT family N-acetyltransferase [Lachnospiraceae bacterium]
MKQIKENVPPIKCDNYWIRLMNKSDIEQYFNAGFANMDPEMCRLTGTNAAASLDSIRRYVLNIVDDDTRYDFLIFDENNIIVGEVVLNEIDWTLRVCNFRICIFKESNFGKKIGSVVIPEIIKFGFECLNLHRIELDVFDFNERAIRAYQKSGFVIEGQLRKAHLNVDGWHDVILMAILEEDYYSKRQ